MKKPIVGDIFEIPLSKREKAYGHYLYYSKMGPIIQVFDLVAKSDIAIEQVIEANPLFPPVITGLFAAVRDKMWKVIGHQTVINFVHPKFVSALYDEHTGKVNKWSLWDGVKFVRIGSELPQRYKGFEYLVVWNPTDIVQRIETGEMPFPYGELIRKNEFTPRAQKQ
jgi:hypothetical protein